MTDHIIIGDFIEKCINNFFQKVDNNDNFKKKTVTYKGYKSKRLITFL